MTKTNRFTLIATILLGVLLYTVIRFAHDLNVAWDGSPREPPPRIADPNAPAHPRIATTADLRAILIAHGIDAATALDGYTDWSDARGFTGANRLFGTVNSGPVDTFAADDAIQLRARSDAGDATATQALAAQLLFTDPFSAIELFGKAAEQGSTFALLRIASLLEALDTASSDNPAEDPGQQQRVENLAKRGVGNNLQLTALGYLVTAVRDGGTPIVDPALLAWLDRLQNEATRDELIAVCAWSERTLLEIAGNRARRGKSPVTTNAPPVFLTIPRSADRLPCRRTAYAIENLLDLTHCTVTTVRNASDEDLDLYICLDDQEASSN